MSLTAPSSSSRVFQERCYMLQKALFVLKYVSWIYNLQTTSNQHSFWCAKEAFTWGRCLFESGVYCFQCTCHCGVYSGAALKRGNTVCGNWACVKCPVFWDSPWEDDRGCSPWTYGNLLLEMFTPDTVFCRERLGDKAQSSNPFTARRVLKISFECQRTTATTILLHDVQNFELHDDYDDAEPTTTRS